MSSIIGIICNPTVSSSGECHKVWQLRVDMPVTSFDFSCSTAISIGPLYCCHALCRNNAGSNQSKRTSWNLQNFCILSIKIPPECCKFGIRLALEAHWLAEHGSSKKSSKSITEQLNEFFEDFLQFWVLHFHNFALALNFVSLTDFVTKCEISLAQLLLPVLTTTE